MAGPRSLGARLDIGQRAIASGILGDIGGFLKDAILGEAEQTFFPPPGPLDPGPRTPQPPPGGFERFTGDPVSVDPTPIADRVGVVDLLGIVGGCPAGFVLRNGRCEEAGLAGEFARIIPGGRTGFAPNGAATGTGLTRPRATARTVLECPRFADGKKGILWMNALTGDVLCLPRATNGKGFGLIRKNKPRAKPFISAAEKKLLTKITTVQRRAKSFATSAGFICRSKPGQPTPPKKNK